MNRWSVSALDRGLGEHAAAWDALNERLFKSNAMMGSRFVSALLKYFGDGTERLCVFHSLGVAQSMCVLRPRSLGIWATFLPAQSQIGPSLLERPDTIIQLFQALPGVVTQIDMMCSDPEFGDLTSGVSPPREIRDHALTMSTSLAGDFTQYWSARPKKLVQNMARYERRLAADQIEALMVCITQPAAMAAAISRYAALESTGWKGKIGTALNFNETQGRFYLEVARQYAESGQTMVYELWLGDRLAASRLAIHAQQTLIMLKTSYDEELSQYAPGRLLLQRVIQDAHDRFRGGCIEYCTDATVDQLAWATGQRWIQHVSFYRNALASTLSMLQRTGRNAWHLHPGAEPGRARQEHLTSVDVYHHPHEFPADVAQLLEAAQDLGIEAGVGWYHNLIDTVYPRHDGVRFYVLRRSGKPVAALPVLIERRTGGNHVSALSNYYTALYAPAIALELKAEALVPLLRAVCAAHAPLSSLSFAPMDPQSHTYRQLRCALQFAGLAPFHYFCFGNWFLTGNMDWPAYLAGRNGKIRSTLKRMGEKFAAAGGSMEIVLGGPDLERAIQAFERVYAASWKVPEPFPEFVPGLIRTCAERGWLRLGLAWLQGEPIAAQLWIVAGGKANIYKLAYQEPFKAYAPGTLLTAHLMQYAMEIDKVGEVDYLIGDDDYKKSWMSDRRERWGVIAYNLGTASGLAGLTVELMSRAFVTARSSASATWAMVRTRLRQIRSA